MFVRYEFEACLFLLCGPKEQSRREKFRTDGTFAAASPNNNCCFEELMAEISLDSMPSHDTIDQESAAAADDGLYVEMDEVTHEEYQENFADFMTDIQNHVKQLASESSRAPQDAYEAFQGKAYIALSSVCFNTV